MTRREFWKPVPLIGLALAATIITRSAGAPAEGDPERGLSVATQWCNSCHIVQQNDPGMDDGNVAPRFSTLTQQTARTLKRLLAPGHADMDALSKLTDEDAANIAAHLKRLKPEPP